MSSSAQPVWRHHAQQAAQLYVEAANSPTLAVAESLTAGLISATVATIPGASRVLRGGVVTYATDLKATLAGVSEAVLRRDGAVAPTTAREMAQGIQVRAGADIGIGVTGVAGPDRQEGKPVGLVYVGYCCAPDVRGGDGWDGPCSGVMTAAEILGVVQMCEGFPVVPGDRDEIRWAAVCAALTLASRLAGNKIETSYVN